jgi:hypothetical protein
LLWTLKALSKFAVLTWWRWWRMFIPEIFI